ncbi:MAG TPA: cyclase family protein [Dehalococcoidia bacterium]
MEIIDVSVPIRPGMIVYEGDPDIRMQRVASIADGAICNITSLDLGVHTGTHIDAPVHFIEGAGGVESVALDALIGPAVVVDAIGISRDIDAAALRELMLPDGAERVIFKTPNSELWSRASFSSEFFGLTEDGARALVDRSVRLVGIDYLSIAPMGNPAPTHVALLGAGIVILEGLDLRNVRPGNYTLMCLPLRLEGSDGAPARTVLVRE